ncbi:hypothetical protein [Tissierella sp. P1]|uniref:hypothetical protein n=1 Tax=Tissierella sp. P1 TaxID=1280483 RepID=UPI001303B4CC|nr:hypothetical protein [Tissierella sp. P1]
MEIKVINLSDESEFENIVNAYLKEGWKVSSTSCGFIDSDTYNYASVLQVILIKEEC